MGLAVTAGDVISIQGQPTPTSPHAAEWVTRSILFLCTQLVNNHIALTCTCLPPPRAWKFFQAYFCLCFCNNVSEILQVEDQMPASGKWRGPSVDHMKQGELIPVTQIMYY